MILLNFNVGDDFISVTNNGKSLDLHNIFDFASYNYSVANREFRLIFTKSSEKWAANETITKLVFVFSQVNFLKIKEGDSSDYPNEENSLSDIGFSAYEMRQDMEGFLASNDFKDNYDMIFLFMSGLSIKVNSKEVLLETF